MKTLPLLSSALILAVLTAGLSACRPILSTEQSVVTQPLERVLFKDDFSNPESGWIAASNPGGSAGYADGAYRIALSQPNSDAWATAGLMTDSVQVEVEAIKVGGDRNNRFGILCRVQAPDRYYVFLVSSDGYSGIGKVDQGRYELLGSQSLLPSDKIPTGSAYIRLRAECVDDSLRLYVNGRLINEASDQTFSSGDVGLIAGAYQTAGVDILFDNFRVTKP